MTTTAPRSPLAGGTEERSDAALLDAARRSQEVARSGEVGVLIGAVEWAVAHPPRDAADRCWVPVPRPGYRDNIAPLNGEGVPEASAVAVAELALVLGLTTESGRLLVADALELAYRLPTIWERVRPEICWRGRPARSLH